MKLLQLRYGGDYRPFFTIHDSDFNRYTEATCDAKQPGQRPAVILGATNPFFIKSFDHWPHICTIGYESGPRPKKKGPGSGFQDIKENLKTSHKAHMPVDEALLKSLFPAKSGSSLKKIIRANNEIMRRYFVELTEQFLAPLESYFNLYLMPRNK